MGHLLPVLPMPVTNPKVVPIIELVHIWCQNEAVLIYFIGVVRNVADSSGKRVLGDYILFNYLRRLPGRRGSGLEFIIKFVIVPHF